MRKARRIFAIALCALMLVSTLAVGAANQWVFKGHRIDDAAIASGIFVKGWYEVDANGIPTGRVKEEGVAKNVEWRHVWYEKDYPHAEIVALYLEGKYAGIIKESGAVADWKVEYVPEMWEAKYPYRVLERLTTIMPDGTRYANRLVHRNVTANDLLKYLGKNEAVTMSYEYFGFGPYRIIDKETIEAANYRPVAYHCTTWNCDHKQCTVSAALANNYYTWTGAKTVNGDYVVKATALLEAAGIYDYALPFGNGELYNCANVDEDAVDAAIANAIKVYKSQYLMGPDYATNSIQKIDIATAFALTKDASLYDPHFIMSSPADKVAQLTWTNPLYEEEFPYAEYELLVVDGVVMNGQNGLPYVYRMTGGNATPDLNTIYNIKDSGWVNPFTYPQNYNVANAGIADAVVAGLAR